MAEEKVSLRQSATWGAVAFGVMLAAVIGMRLEQAALAVVTGVACGVTASIPTSLLIVSILRRQDSRAEKRKTRTRWDAGMQPPPMVVMAPPNVARLPQREAWPDEFVAHSPAQRKFSVIGEEGMENELDDR